MGADIPAFLFTATFHAFVAIFVFGAGHVLARFRWRDVIGTSGFPDDVILGRGHGQVARGRAADAAVLVGLGLAFEVEGTSAIFTRNGLAADHVNQGSTTIASGPVLAHASGDRRAVSTDAGVLLHDHTLGVLRAGDVHARFQTLALGTAIVVALQTEGAVQVAVQVGTNGHTGSGFRSAEDGVGWS